MEEIDMAYKHNGRWRGEVRVNGQRKTKLFDKKKDAQEWEIKTSALMVAEQQQEQLLTLKDPDSIQLGPSYEEYLDEVQTTMSEKTYKEKLAVGQRFIKFMGGPQLLAREILRIHVKDYMNKQAKKRSGNAVNKDRKNLLAYWNWLIETYELDLRNPFDVKKKPEVSHPRYVPPFSDFQKVFEQAEEGQDRILLQTYFLTAARKSEIIKMKWSEVKFELMQFGLWTKKRENGNEELDWQAMSPNLATELMKQKLVTGQGEYVFVNPRKGRGFLDRRNWLRKLCDDAGVKRFGFHGIRHLAAHIAILTETMTLPDVQHLLRHKSILTTQRYVEQVRKGAKASEVLGDYLKSATRECHTAANCG
jgi:integrase